MAKVAIRTSLVFCAIGAAVPLMQGGHWIAALCVGCLLLWGWTGEESDG